MHQYVWFECHRVPSLLLRAYLSACVGTLLLHSNVLVCFCIVTCQPLCASLSIQVCSHSPNSFPFLFLFTSFASAFPLCLLIGLCVLVLQQCVRLFVCAHIGVSSLVCSSLHGDDGRNTRGTATQGGSNDCTTDQMGPKGKLEEVEMMRVAGMGEEHKVMTGDDQLQQVDTMKCLGITIS